VTNTKVLKNSINYNVCRIGSAPKGDAKTYNSINQTK